MKTASFLTSLCVVAAAALPQESGVTVRLSSPKPEATLRVVASGGGGTLKIASGKRIAPTDTIQLGSAVTLQFDPDSGAAVFEVVGANARLRADVVAAGGLPRFTAEAQRLLVHRTITGRLEVQSVPPDYKLGT